MATQIKPVFVQFGNEFNFQSRIWLNEASEVMGFLQKMVRQQWRIHWYIQELAKSNIVP